MKKSFQPQSIIILLTVLIAAAGTVLRISQLRLELLSDGSLAQGSFLHYLLIGLIAVLVVSLTVLLLPLPNQKSWKGIFTAHPIANVFLLLGAAGLLLGNVLLLLKEPQSSIAQLTQFPQLTNVFLLITPPLGMVSAVCIAVFSLLCTMNKKPSPLLYMIASIYLVLRLIVHFQVWNTDPSIHDYCFKLLAAICSMLGTFQLAGFCFDKGLRRIAAFWTLCAVVFGCISLADHLLRGTADELLIAASLSVIMAVSAVQLLFCKTPLPPEQKSPSDT